MEPSTTVCPILPGQQVNIVEVPVQMVDGSNRRGSCSSIASNVFTLDPMARYMTPKPSIGRAVLESKHHSMSLLSRTNEARDLALKTPQEIHSSALYQRATIPLSQTRKPKSSGSMTRRLLLSTICKMRGTRSAGFAERRKSSNSHRVCPDKARHAVSEASCAQDCNFSSAAKTSTLSAAGSPGATVTHNALQPTGELLVSMQKALHLVGDLPPEDRWIPLSLGPMDDEITPNTVGRGNSRGSNLSPYHTPPEQLQKHMAPIEEALPSYRCLPSVDATLISLCGSGSDTRPADANAVQITLAANDHGRSDRSYPGYDETYYGAHDSSASISSSYTTNKLFSPGLAASTIQTDGMSPYHLSQPDTPSISEFGGEVLGTRLAPTSDAHLLSSVREPKALGYDSMTSLHDTDYLNPGELQGYSLAKAEQASELTLQKFPTTATASRGVGSTFGKPRSKDLVHSWNDGSEHRITALEELINDLGYLGELIL